MLCDLSVSDERCSRMWGLRLRTTRGARDAAKISRVDLACAFPAAALEPHPAAGCVPGWKASRWLVFPA